MCYLLIVLLANGIEEIVDARGRFHSPEHAYEGMKPIVETITDQKVIKLIDHCEN